MNTLDSVARTPESSSPQSDLDRLMVFTTSGLNHHLKQSLGPDFGSAVTTVTGRLSRQFTLAWSPRKWFSRQMNINVGCVADIADDRYQDIRTQTRVFLESYLTRRRLDRIRVAVTYHKQHGKEEE